MLAQVVIETLQGLLDQDLSFMAPVLDCFSNMQLDPHLQVSSDNQPCLSEMQPDNVPSATVL